MSEGEEALGHGDLSPRLRAQQSPGGGIGRGAAGVAAAPGGEQEQE